MLYFGRNINVKILWYHSTKTDKLNLGFFFRLGIDFGKEKREIKGFLVINQLIQIYNYIFNKCLC